MKTFGLFLFFFVFLLSPNKVIAKELFTFKVTTGEKTEYETLVVEITQQGFMLKTPISSNSFDGSYNQLVWEVFQAAEGSSFKAQRFGNTIKLQGTFRHRPVSREYAIDARPWYQYPEVTLKEFALSAKKRIEFWIISPDDLALFEFEAVKMGRETVEVSGRSVNAVRIRIKALGFAGNFWHADYWFALADGGYLRYQAVHGGPGTPPTIKELVESGD
ncbi:MAG: hypothetical protein JW822_14395 [Spirochaetales bacterium]|nr:hypothetical protein [Spirochaetales bacterium]